MAAGSNQDVESVDPEAGWRALEHPGALLVDVRTRAEWSFVGVPSLEGRNGKLALVEWTRFPDGAPNDAFLEELDAARRESGASEVFFLCRSGARSRAAARAAAEHWRTETTPPRCVNVEEGFEGDLDGEGRRGRLNGWKARGLPWRQS